MSVSSLPKTVTRQRRDCDLNPGPSAHESITLTTRLPNHHHGRNFYLSLSSAILMDSSTGSPVHVLMLSIQAVRGLLRLRAPAIVPCVISSSLISSWCDHSMLDSLL